MKFLLYICLGIILTNAVLFGFDFLEDPIKKENVENASTKTQDNFSIDSAKSERIILNILYR